MPTLIVLVSFMTLLTTFVPLPVLFSLLSLLILISISIIDIAPVLGPLVDALVVPVFVVVQTTQNGTHLVLPTNEDGNDTIAIATSP